MKYCNVKALTLARLLGPATDQIWLASTPSVQGSGCTSTTAAGPNPSFPVPVSRCVAVGIRNVGPTPKSNFPVVSGARKNVGFKSPTPDDPPVGLVTSG